MKTVLLLVSVLGLGLAYGQTASMQQPPDTPGVKIDNTPTTAILRKDSLQVGVKTEMATGQPVSRVLVVVRNVNIQMGENVLVADEAEIRYRADGKFDVVELRGNVRLKAKLEVQ
jgi:hypothetical protein